MVKNELEQKLEEGVISQKEYDYLIQNRTSGLPSYYKSAQFILFLVLVPVLQSILFRMSVRLFMEYGRSGYLLGNISIQVVLAGIYFLVYKFTKKAPLKMAAWVWMIITLGSMLNNLLFSMYIFLGGNL